MASKTEQRLAPEFRKLNKAKLVGERTRHTVTFNPNTAKPSEQVYVTVPKLSRSDCLVPESLHLCLDLKVSNTKNHFKNNLAKCCKEV